MKTLVLFLVAVSGMQAYAGGGSSIGPANPAALNCLKLGGTLQNYKTPGGESNLCMIEEWKLFRFMNQCHLVQIHHQGSQGMPNPASVNCADVGGTVQIQRDAHGQFGICVVDEWTLFRSVDAEKCQ